VRCRREQRPARRPARRHARRTRRQAPAGSWQQENAHARVAQQDTDQNAQADGQYPEEYLSSIKDGRLPAHVLRLKVGAPVIALRNITKGVCNGTRMVVTRLLRNSIFARVLHVPMKGQEVAITKVFSTHNMGAFELQRRQLPIRVAFAMTNDDQQGPGTRAPQSRRARRG
jgi:hypothetical protein